MSVFWSSLANKQFFSATKNTYPNNSYVKYHEQYVGGGGGNSGLESLPKALGTQVLTTFNDSIDFIVGTGVHKFVS